MGNEEAGTRDPRWTTTGDTPEASFQRGVQACQAAKWVDGRETAGPKEQDVKRRRGPQTPGR